MATETASTEPRRTSVRERAPDAGGPHRPPARDARHAGHRGAGDDALSPGQGPGLLLRRLRPGGRLGRPDLGDARPRPALHPAPRPRGAPDPRRLARPHPRPVHGPRGRHHGRARRQRALRRAQGRLRRHGLDAARHDARRRGPRDGLQDARGAARGADLVRRRLDLPRRLPRGDELGRRAEAAGDLHPREQPVRLLHADGVAVRGRPGRARRRIRLPRRQRRRQRRRGDVRGDAPGARSRDRGRGPDADRGRHDAHARPRRARRHEVRAGGADRGVEAQGPDRPPGPPPGAARRRRRRAARGGQGRDRRRRRGGAGDADARRRDRDRAACSPTSPRCSRTPSRAGAGSRCRR